MGHQPDRIVQRNQITCGTRRWDATVESSPTIRPNTRPSAKLVSLSLNGKAVEAAKRTELAEQVARLAAVQSVSMRCDEGDADVLVVTGDVMDGSGRRSPSRVRARLTAAGPTGVTLDAN